MINLLFETLDSNFEIKRDKGLESEINHGLTNSICSGHTAVMHSDHMKQNGLHVIRLMPNEYGNKTIEYHLHSEKYDPGEKRNKVDMSNKSVLHALNIISKDAKGYLDKGHTIKLQAQTDYQHELYKKFANHLIKKYNINDRKVKDIGYTKSLLGTDHKTTIIEHSIVESTICTIMKIIREKHANL